MFLLINQHDDDDDLTKWRTFNDIYAQCTRTTNPRARVTVIRR